MPMHDWDGVPANVFRAFRDMWIAALVDRLNGGGLPPSHFAVPEAVLSPLRRNRIAVHTDIESVSSVIEIAPAIECGARGEVRHLADNIAVLIRNGVHVLVIDPFPPGRYDPKGIHSAVWKSIAASEFGLTADKPLTAASYQAGREPTAYVDPFTIGESIPAMPLFLAEDRYVTVPFEETYQATWNVLPPRVRGMVEPLG